MATKATIAILKRSLELETKAEGRAKCKYKGCSEETLETSKEGYCIFHDRDDNKNAKEFQKKLRQKIKSEDYDFNGYYFIGTTDFSDHLFLKNVSFEEAHFMGDVSFKKAKFKGDVVFGDALFSGKADFWGAQFSAKTYFWRTRFSHGALFRLAQFSKYAHFHSAAFNGDANFMTSEFLEDANFENAFFFEDAFFLGSKFFGKAVFKDVLIHDRAHFEESRFYQEVDFGSLDLGIIRFADSNIDSIDLSRATWSGDLKNIYEKDAEENKDDNETVVFLESYRDYKDAEQVYRKVKISYTRIGNYDLAGKFYYREMECKRKQIRFEKVNTFKKLGKHILCNVLRF